MGHHDLQNQPRPTREKEGDGEVREREREGWRERGQELWWLVCV